LQVAGTGFETSSVTSGNQYTTEQSGAESGAVGAPEARSDASDDAAHFPTDPLDDPELREVAEAWPTLADAVKARIVALIRSAGEAAGE
jgi:hypothetical protein